MEALVFPSEEALQVAMRSGLVPQELQREPARVGTTEDGALEIVPEGTLTARAKKALLAAGVEARSATVELSEVSCWAEAIAPRRVGEPSGALQQVLFTVTGGRSLLELSGELLRLGCDRQELSMVKSPHAHALVRVVDPPWFVLSRALDHLDGLRAFVPTTPGQERLWTEVSWSHPLDTTLEAPDVGMVLMTREGPWWRISDSEWIDIDQLVVPVGLGAVSRVQPTEDAPKVQVTLTLARAARPEPATLFVLPSGQGAVEALVRSTPEAQLENILFVVASDLVILRARPGREANAGALPGEAYSRVLDMPNLFGPAALTVEPPLRRDRLRTWLAPDPDLITWLEPTPGGFSRRSVLEAAFRPLTEWVDYVIDGAAETLQTWARSASFDFEPFVALEDAQPSERENKDEDEVQRSRPRNRREARPSTPRDAPANETAPRASMPVVAIELPSSLSEAEAVVAREETAFLELEAAADSPARRHAWVRLAEMYSRVQRGRDSGMAWAHALWESGPDDALRIARRWADTSGVRLEGLLNQTAPDFEKTRGAVAHLFAASLESNQSVAARVTDWATFLDKFSEDLDVRSYWLGRVAVSRLAGGDTLGLARARDRVLARVQGGLSLDRDVPRLMRVMGQATAAGAGTGRAMRVGAQLEALLKAFEETPRKRSAVESPPQLTRAYVGLEFAWGFARLANAERARQLRDAALNVLDRKDPVHAYLTRAYVARIDQALEGVAPYTPLAPEINGLLTGLESLDRYKVDRLRQFSQVLEPQERLEAISQFWRNNAREGRGEELAALRSLREPAELLKAIQSRMSVAADAQLGVEERVRLIDGLLDYLPQLPESQALPLLQRFLTIGDALAAKHRAVVLEDALKVAGHFGRAALVKQLVLQLGNAIKEVGGEGVGEIGGLLVSGVRSLRRVGLREEAGELLARASTVLKGEDVPTLQARLGLASGFMYLGAFAQAQPIIDESLSRLGRESGLIIAERIKLTRATAQALSHASTELALPGLLRVAQQLPWITDSFNTNSHFCLSMVDFADALVLGHVGDDLTLNETTRRFLDEDEYLVRRRVHRDVGGDT
jgi:cellulose synthase operon protein C